MHLLAQSWSSGNKGGEGEERGHSGKPLYDVWEKGFRVLTWVATSGHKNVIVLLYILTDQILNSGISYCGHMERTTMMDEKEGRETLLSHLLWYQSKGSGSLSYVIMATHIVTKGWWWLLSRMQFIKRTQRMGMTMIMNTQISTFSWLLTLYSAHPNM